VLPCREFDDHQSRIRRSPHPRRGEFSHRQEPVEEIDGVLGRRAHPQPDRQWDTAAALSGGTQRGRRVRLLPEDRCRRRTVRDQGMRSPPTALLCVSGFCSWQPHWLYLFLPIDPSASAPIQVRCTDQYSSPLGSGTSTSTCRPIPIRPTGDAPCRQHASCSVLKMTRIPGNSKIAESSRKIIDRRNRPYSTVKRALRMVRYIHIIVLSNYFPIRLLRQAGSHDFVIHPTPATTP